MRDIYEWDSEWMIYYHNEITGDSGVYEYGLEKAFAKWLTRYMNKKQKSVFYWAEPEPQRYC